MKVSLCFRVNIQRNLLIVQDEFGKNICIERTDLCIVRTQMGHISL
jgi:hypothetical protein